MEHAERLCDRIILMAGGRKVFDGTTEEALAKAPRRMVIGSDTDGYKDKVAAFAKSLEDREDGALNLILKDTAKSQDVAMVGKDLLATMELEQAEAAP